MIQITPQHQLFLYVPAIDFRKGIDALVGLCRSKIKQDPFSGAFFIFRNNQGTAVKLIAYDGTGFWLMHKRFSRGTLLYWPKSMEETVCATTLMIILNQGQPARLMQAWRPLPSSNNLKYQIRNV